MAEKAELIESEMVAKVASRWFEDEVMTESISEVKIREHLGHKSMENFDNARVRGTRRPD